MPEPGRLLENLVAIELYCCQFYNENVLKLYYWSDYEHHEVDFVLMQNHQIIQLIQVSAISDQSEVSNREFKCLCIAAQELHCTQLLLITWEYEGTEKMDMVSINCIPLWKWLITQ